ncbi:hypothetical protein [Paraburkholderia pallida]
MAIAARHTFEIETTVYPVARANDALADLRDGRLTGAALLMMR